MFRQNQTFFPVLLTCAINLPVFHVWQHSQQQILLIMQTWYETFGQGSRQGSRVIAELEPVVENLEYYWPLLRPFNISWFLGFLCKRVVRSTGHLNETSVNGCEMCATFKGKKRYNGKKR